MKPSDILDKQLKTGIGYDKKEVEQFLHDISSDFRTLHQENADLSNKIKELNESMSYYKSIEKTLQKALILAEKTAQDTRATAIREADATLMEAKARASHMLADSRKHIDVLEHKTLNLKQQYDLFKIHYESLLKAQLELLNSKGFSINTNDFTYHETEDDNTSNYDILTEDELSKSIQAITEDAETALQAQEDKNQLSLDLSKTQLEVRNRKTEDGFEFL